MLAAALDGVLGRNPNVRIISQYKHGPYRFDFCVRTVDGRMVLIECDGAAYHRTRAQLRNDRAKDRYARRLTGRACLRFTGSEIWRDARGCARQIGSIAGAYGWDRLHRG